MSELGVDTVAAVVLPRAAAMQERIARAAADDGERPRKRGSFVLVDDSPFSFFSISVSGKRESAQITIVFVQKFDLLSFFFLVCLQ